MESKVDRRTLLTVLAGSVGRSAPAQDPPKPTTPPRPMDAPIDVSIPAPLVRFL